MLESGSTGNKRPTITKQDESLSIKKENGTVVDYFLFDKFEVHTNSIPAGCVQDWHIHNDIEEIILVHEGSLHLEWIETERIEQEVQTGEIIRMNKSIHRLSNPGTSEAKCVIIRFVSPTENQQEKIKNDKIIYSDAEIEQLLQKNKA